MVREFDSMKRAMVTHGVLDEVAIERKRQDTLWGEQNHSPALYLTILLEEVGEVATEIFNATTKASTLDYTREELIQVAAVAVAMVEAIDRRKI